MADQAADELIKTLEEIGKKSTTVTELTKALREFNKEKTKAMRAGDTKALTSLLSLEKATYKLRQAEEKRLELQAKLKKMSKEKLAADQEFRKSLVENQEAIEKEKAVIQAALKSQVDAYNQLTKEQAEYREGLIKNFRENTKLGKVFALADNALAKYAAGLTFASLAMKAFNRISEAAETRQKILIQGFRGFTEPLGQVSQDVKATAGSIEKAGISIGNVFGSAVPGSVAKTAATFYQARAAIFDYNEAFSKAEVTALRMGVSTDMVSGTMVDFARITGITTPEALGKLTEGAIAISRAMGITVPEAVDFVSTRMDKFGGTAASALIALNELRVESERINNAFGRTVIRGDDLAKTLQSISSQTTVYAIDQRIVGGILRDNIARLQATGESYENATKKATTFAEALAGGKAPEWMQVLAGEDLVGSMRKAFGKGGEEGIKAFQEQFGASLDAAKPGLSKRVQDILASIGTGPGKRNAYEAMRLIQELTQGTSVGIDAMNRQILQLADATGGSVEVIAKQMNVSRDVADSMIQQARAWDAEQKEIAKYAAMTPDKLAESLGISKALAEVMAGANVSEAEKKKNLADYLKLQNESKMKAQEEARLQEEAVRYNEKKKKTEAEIVDLRRAQELALKEGKTDDAETIERMIKTKQAELSQLVSDALARQAKAEELNIQLGQVGDITEELKNKFLAYSVASGNYFKELFAKLGTLPVLIGGAVAVGIFKTFRIFSRLENKMAESIIANKAGHSGIIKAILSKWRGGKGGGGGDIDMGDGDGKKRRKRDRRTKKKGGLLSRMGKKAGGIGKALSGSAKGAMNLVKKAPLLKGSVVGGLVGLATNYDDIVEAINAGSTKEAIAKLAPALGGTVGGLVGGTAGAALGPLGALGVGYAGSEAGERIGQVIADYLTKEESNKAAVAEEKRKEFQAGMATMSALTPKAEAAKILKMPEKPKMEGLGKDAVTRPPVAPAPTLTRPEDLKKALAPISDLTRGQDAAANLAAETTTVAAAAPTATQAPVGEFGAIAADGSITIKVANFMQAFAQGQAMSKNRIRTSG